MEIVLLEVMVNVQLLLNVQTMLMMMLYNAFIFSVHQYPAQLAMGNMNVKKWLNALILIHKHYVKDLIANMNLEHVQLQNVQINQNQNVLQ